MAQRIAKPIKKSAPGTDAERLVAELCDRTFLSLWSYPSVFHDKGKATRGEGQEICDLLVVFGDDVVVFSDKDCNFPDSGDLAIDWARWFKRAVSRAADQVWGAERWLREQPKRVYLDRRCETVFPVPLPQSETARYHLVVVAHGSGARSDREVSGGGGLVVTNTVDGSELHRRPFTIGDLDRRRRFVHVFDDFALPVVLQAFDTIVDFVSYLSARERLLRWGPPVLARSEQDLIAVYLEGAAAKGSPGFPVMALGEGMLIDAGEWVTLTRSSWWQEQRRLDEISYAWDHMIESFATHTLNDTRQFSYPHDDFSDSEIILRHLAREPRQRRRMLARAWLEALVKSAEGGQYTRWLVPTEPGQPFWVFLFFPRLPHIPYENYRETRAAVLEACCRAIKLAYPAAEDIVAIASESGLDHVGRSEDAMYFNARVWDEAEERKSREMQARFEVMQDVTRVAVSEAHFATYPTELLETLKKSVRESPCPCGSGRAYVECHADAT